MDASVGTVFYRLAIWLLPFSLALPSFRFIMMLLEKDLSLTFRPLLLLRLPELAIIHFTSRRLDSWRAPRPASTVSAVSSSQTIRTPPDFPRPGRQILVQTFRQTNQVTPSRASFLGNISPSHSSVTEAGSISVSERRFPRSPKYAYHVGGFSSPKKLGVCDKGAERGLKFSTRYGLSCEL